ncbi:endonuclease III [Simkania negevensis]|uniref:Endonuclease III n=1 Tax=Simkania negevensis TaxID=83561 RepID=A0ABS3AR42_9BACT|nr:endonuclease III [Simkania negevensis]
MKKKERVEKIQEILEKFYPNPSIPLRHKNPYTLLIAVLLSAQCTDVRVNETTPKLFALAETPEKMAELDVAAIEEEIRPLGLAPRKAKAIKRLSQILVERYDGKVPKNFEDLESLPGVGHKTASVVRTQAFGLPAFPVDTHIHRCANRWRLTRSKTVEKTEKVLKKLFPEEVWGKLHLQIIYFAREHCPARGHDPQRCPICSLS